MEATDRYGIKADAGFAVEVLMLALWQTWSPEL